MSRVRPLLLLCALLAGFGTALAAPPPSAGAKPAKARAVNFSGRWVLDVPKCDFGPNAKSIPRWRRDLVEHKGALMRVQPHVVKVEGDTTHMEYRYRTDGLEAVNQVMNLPVQTIGKWNGNTLELVSNTRVMTATFRMTEWWSLADAGRTLVIVRDSDSPLGKRHSRMVYRKE